MRRVLLIPKIPNTFTSTFALNCRVPVGTPQVRDITGSVTDNSDVVADIFADVFSKVFTKESRDRIPAVPGPPNSTFLSDIDFLETVVCEKIRKLKVSKSPGPDLITAKVLSNCAAELSVPLSVLMKAVV
jgi:hypothetical protein